MGTCGSNDTVTDSPACADLAAERPASAARRLAAASVSANTRRAYTGALGQARPEGAGGQQLPLLAGPPSFGRGNGRSAVPCSADRSSRTENPGRLPRRAARAGESPSSASTTVVAACFRARLAGEQSRPSGCSPAYRRTAGGRGRGQARPFVAADLAAVLASCCRPRRRGCGVESDEVAVKRGRLDAVIAGLLFMAVMRRSEVSALLWGDVAEAAADGAGVLVTVRRGKTNPEGEARDVRFVKGRRRRRPPDAA